MEEIEGEDPWSLRPIVSLLWKHGYEGLKAWVKNHYKKEKRPQVSSTLHLRESPS